MVIAAVADGLGSCTLSHTGSAKAVQTSTRYCKKHITRSSSSEDILRIIKASFSEAKNKIEKTADSQGNELNQYHTTLSLAVLIDDTLYYGHAGDSGIIALTTEGRFEKVTEQQRDEDDRVFTLFFEDRWGFGQFDQKVCSVLLATDGMLHQLTPRQLEENPVKINVNRAGWLMDNRCLHIDEKGEKAVRGRVRRYVIGLPPQAVDEDDLTIVVLINTSIEPGTQPKEYYEEQDQAPPNSAECGNKESSPSEPPEQEKRKRNQSKNSPT
jgi:hypothetical protein